MGGGYIAAEQCCIYNGFGADVHLFFRGEHMLNGFDMENRIHLEQEFKKQGISLWPTYSPTKASWVCSCYSIGQVLCLQTVLLGPRLVVTIRLEAQRCPKRSLACPGWDLSDRRAPSWVRPGLALGVRRAESAQQLPA